MGPYNTPIGIPFDQLTSISDRRVLTINFTGAKGGADKPCGADYWAEPVFSEHAVVLMLHGRGYPGGGACTMEGYPRQVTLELAQPLGSRIVLEGVSSAVRSR